MNGNLGRGVVKISSLAGEHWVIEEECRVFHTQEAVRAAFRAGELDRDVVVVVRFQGPKANGMPELHKPMRPLGVLQDKGFRVALVTDGRLSGASGKVPSAIHVTPEARSAGPLAKLRDGDRVRLDIASGRLEAVVPEAEWAARTAVPPEAVAHERTGRELFAPLRELMSRADAGTTLFSFEARGA